MPSKQQFWLLLIMRLKKNVLPVKDAKVGLLSCFSLACSNIYRFHRFLVKIELYYLGFLGAFPFSSLGHRGFLCMSCSDVETSQASPAATRTSTSAPACITSPVKSRLKITRKLVTFILCTRCHKVSLLLFRFTSYVQRKMIFFGHHA